MGSRVVSPQSLVNFYQLDVNLWKINMFWACKKPDTETYSLISKNFTLEVVF